MSTVETKINAYVEKVSPTEEQMDVLIEAYELLRAMI